MTNTALRTVAGVQPEKPKDIFGMLKMYQSEIARALPKHMTADRMARIATTEIRKAPKLLQCDMRSLFGAVIQCSQLGLEPGGGLGHAYLVPYGKECQLIIGYRGMIDLARRSGQMISLSGEAVYAKDKFEYELGLEPKLKHIPSTDEERGALVYVYAVANLTGGGRQFVVMSRGDIERIKRRSKAASSGPWVSDYDAMAIKTAIRRLFKYLPVSVEMQRAVVLDEAAERGEQNNAAVLDGDYAVSTDDAPADDAIAGESTRDAAAPADLAGGFTFKQVAAAIHEANSIEALDLATDMIRGVADERQRAELDIEQKAKRKTLA